MVRLGSVGIYFAFINLKIRFGRVRPNKKPPFRPIELLLVYPICWANRIGLSDLL